MLTVHSVTAHIGQREIFADLSFSLNAGEILGVVGPNGSGKSTLLSILTGERQPASGSVSLAPGKRIGYLRQGFADRPDGTLADLVDVPTGGLATSQVRVDRATASLGAVGDPEALTRYDEAIRAFEDLGGYEAADHLIATMARLAVGPDALGRGWETPLAQLSGGQKTRAGLAALLASRPDLLLLDEPTNHLDTDAAEAVERLVLSQTGAAIIVSHDRAFLDRVATDVLALDDLGSGWTLSAGGYSDLLAARAAEAAEQASAWRRQQDMIDRVEADIRAVAGRAARVEGETQHDYVRGRMKKVARLAVVRERRLERLLDSEERIEKPRQRWGLSVELPPAPPGGQEVAVATDLSVSLGGRPILRDMSFHIRAGDRVALLGANGSGKTTLLRTLLGEIAPTSGSVRLGASIVPGLFSQEQDGIDPDRTVLDHVRLAAPISESDARTYLHRFLFSAEAPLRRAADLSYGERARLALALLILQGANFLVLDEPLNHLDIDSREQFEAALAGFDGTTLMVLHDRRAIERLATRRLLLRDGRLTEESP
ncbi:MAG: hypothetical protein AVDCRST_MAG33-477 [uncultured Thermomicrobiales bacterium]|uniref:ABC transporter domain-containing protein n=1 Tax=uncultured Thermomicrobiales bacterium TaxID=1645740 RepID=A0A6J4UER4_9BACT|nr:MAG: hypothetical protein AVDCRST_MAG33-477 [uncultured Thermomicrobiales bacterium]